MSTAVILNSRQGLRPVGREPWVQNTLKAVKYIASQGHTLSASVGTKPWELTLAAASEKGLPINLYFPENRDTALLHDILIQYGIKEDMCRPCPVKSGASLTNSREFQTNRDGTIIEQADIIIPVSIKPKGNLDKLISDTGKNDKIIIEDFRVPYEPSKTIANIEIDHGKNNPELDRLFDNHIIHWTRTANFRWPGETARDYYGAIIKAADCYPRTALKTLERILTERILYASSRHYRRGYSAVAFSELKPSEAVHLMKWRARYREMTFEPYGIALPIDLAEKFGVRRVIYGDPDVYKLLKPADRPYFQSVGKRGSWLPEKEWRYLVDFDLTPIPQSKLKVIVWKKNEVAEISKIFDGPVYSFYPQ